MFFRRIFGERNFSDFYHGLLGSIGKFYPYGTERPSATGNDTEKFTGYFRDASTGLDYAVNRYEQPGAGRFITPDPYPGSARRWNPGSWNRFAYASGDPINRTDPRGLLDWSLFKDGAVNFAEGGAGVAAIAGAGLESGGLTVLGLSALAISAGTQAGVGLSQMTAGIVTTPGTQANADAQNLQQAVPYTSIFGVTYGVVRGAVTALNGGNVAQAVNTGVLVGYKIQSILTGATAATEILNSKTLAQAFDNSFSIYEGGDALWKVLFGESGQPAETTPLVQGPQPDVTTDTGVTCDEEGCYSTDESITWGQYDGLGEIGPTMDGG